MFFRQYFQVAKCIVKTPVYNQPSVFYASKFTRSRFVYKSSEHIHELIKETLTENRPLAKDEWDELRSNVLNSQNRITNVNIDAILLGYCIPSGKLDIGKSYIEYLKQSEVEPNAATIGSFLKLYYSASKNNIKITDDDRKDIIDLSQDLLNKFPVLDWTICEDVIHALVLTKDWRKSLELIEMIKILTKPKSSAYSVVINRAIQEKDEDVVWKLLNEMVAEGKVPSCYVFTSYINHCCENSNTFVENIEKLLRFIGEHEILVSKEVASAFHNVFNDFGLTSTFTSIAKKGKCRSCDKFLSDNFLTNAEFELLSEKFLDKVLVGKNIFHKSTPDEVEAFVKFVDRTKPYDCVIDGLNVAYSKGIKSPLANSKSLASVVKYFADQNKAVLVIGRNHMKSWPKTQMNYISRNSKVFFTEDLSKDDPFLLYATLKSGPNTDFFSRDLMRDHAFRLDKNLNLIFRRWQQQHQYKLDHVTYDLKFNVHEPIHFNTRAHMLDGCWHIPFIDDVSAISIDLFELPTNWLCVSKISR